MRLSAFVDHFFGSLMILPSLFRYPSLLRTTSMFLSESASTMEMPDLPDENILDILSRLPVKSLMRFKCVSKQWCSLISDPRFIRAHLYQQGQMNSKILLATQPCTLIMDYEDCHNPIVKLNYPGAYLEDKTVEFVGSCDGLVCLLVDRQTFILWNPSTREERELPCPLKWNSGFYACFFFAFGYDSSLDDYKVVTGRCCKVLVDNVDSGIRCTVEVFTLKSNKWKLIEFDNVGHRWYGLGIFLNGNLHWISSEPEDVVLSFNMKEEKFMEFIPLPPDCEDVNHQMCLVASENSLFMLISDWQDSYQDTYHFTVWKKSADVFEDPWTKLCNHSFKFLPYSVSRRYQLHITRYHKLLLKFNVNSVSAVDLEAITLKDFPDTGVILAGIDYLESLISVSADTRVGGNLPVHDDTDREGYDRICAYRSRIGTMTLEECADALEEVVSIAEQYRSL